MTLPQLPHKPRHGEELEVVIQKLSKRGHGLLAYSALIGPQGTHREFRVEVRKALPGERVRMRVDNVRRNEIHGGVVAYLEQRADRIEPRCTHFGRREEEGKGCGGCVLQSLPYPTQLEFKRGIVERALESAGLSAGLLGETVGQPEPWYYRNKMEYSFGPDRNGRIACGMHPVGYHREVLALEHCYLQSPESSQLVVTARQYAEDHGLAPYRHKRNEGWLRTLTVREGKRTSERLVELTTSDLETVSTISGPKPADEVATAFLEALVEAAPVTSVFWTTVRVKKKERTRLTEHHIQGLPVVREALQLPGGKRLEFAIHPRAFFQPNTLQAERLYAEALRATGLLDAPEKRPTVFDLYCGTGTIALCMAPYAERVIGVELVEDAVQNARANAAHNNLTNVTFYAGDVGEVLGGALAEIKPDLIVVDPPRSGLLPAARELLGQLTVPRLVYVSCNPEALARDISELQVAGYSAKSITLVDMFPHTAHIENVAVLERV